MREVKYCAMTCGYHGKVFIGDQLAAMEVFIISSMQFTAADINIEKCENINAFVIWNEKVIVFEMSQVRLYNSDTNGQQEVDDLTHRVFSDRDDARIRVYLVFRRLIGFHHWPVLLELSNREYACIHKHYPGILVADLRVLWRVVQNVHGVTQITSVSLVIEVTMSLGKYSETF